MANVREYNGPFSGVKTQGARGDKAEKYGFTEGISASNFEGGQGEYSTVRESTLSSTGKSTIDIENWGYKDFINERANFIKGTRSLTDEPAWFYFKIFFKFNTGFGLLGGVIGNHVDHTTDTALKYLRTFVDKDRHPSLNLKGRYFMLAKFIKTLSFISSTVPWFFSKVSDVNNGMTMNFDNLNAQKSITIECLEESVDMKLTTMMDMYKFAVYDDVHQLEIIPENLRKFDMDILVFQSPIRYLHTSMITLMQDTAKYKSTTGDGNYTTDMMSYKLFSFKNCEFDYTSLNSMMPSTFTNDNPFKSIPQIKINYDRVYQHDYNEFINGLFGSSGVYTDKSVLNTQITKESLKDANAVSYNKFINNKRGEMLKYLHDHPNYYNLNSTVYKALVDASEENLCMNMRMIDANTALGNLYYDGSIGDTLKNTATNALNNYKNMGKDLLGRWGL